MLDACIRPGRLAGTFALLAVTWGIIDIIANVQIKNYAEDGDPEPCGGTCGNCTIDPHCAAWAARVQANTPLAAVCPPAQRHSPSSESDATFSCVAVFEDGDISVINNDAGQSITPSVVFVPEKDCHHFASRHTGMGDYVILTDEGVRRSHDYFK